MSSAMNKGSTMTTYIAETAQGHRWVLEWQAR